MDTTETYIKMCDCTEIQGQKPDWNTSDFWHWSDSDLPPLPRKVIWLPRQDQLQEMCQPISIDELIRRFSGWYHIWFMSRTAVVACHTSMEQIWLAFVIKEKFGKTWDGAGWR